MGHAFVSTAWPDGKVGAVIDKLLGCYLTVLSYAAVVLLFAFFFGWEFVIVEAIGLAVITIAVFIWATRKGRRL